MSEQVRAALIRAGIAAAVVILGAGQAWVLGQVSDREFAAAVFGATSSFVIRVGEGLYDAHRNETGDIKRSDVKP